MISSPATVIGTSRRADVAGPLLRPSPFSMENLLPWQSQLMVPSETLATRQPWWVQTAENALNSPAVGWVTTTFWSAKIVPPPTSMSEVGVTSADQLACARVADEPPASVGGVGAVAAARGEQGYADAAAAEAAQGPAREICVGGH